MTTIGQRIKRARTAMKLSQANVAKQLSVSRVTVTQWETDITFPTVERLPEIGRVLGVSLDWLVGGVGEPLIERWRDTTGTPLAGDENLPIYGAKHAGSGHTIITTKAIDKTRRPELLVGVVEAYGLLVEDGGMSPTYREGDIILVNPSLPLRSGCDVVLYGLRTSEDTDVEALIKHLNSWTDAEWVLEQWNPIEVLRRRRSQWPVCHRIVGRFSIM